jgi:hypothetical protein
MIFYGWGRKSVPLVELGTATCSKCNDTRPFRVFLSYSYMHLYWIFGAVLGRKYMAACTVCGQGFLLNKKQAKQTVGTNAPIVQGNPIPFMQRWGLATLVAALALFISTR